MRAWEAPSRRRKRKERPRAAARLALLALACVVLAVPQHHSGWGAAAQQQQQQQQCVTGCAPSLDTACLSALAIQAQLCVAPQTRDGLNSAPVHEHTSGPTGLAGARRVAHICCPRICWPLCAQQLIEPDQLYRTGQCHPELRGRPWRVYITAAGVCVCLEG